MSEAGSKPKILIVDDTPENIQVLMEALKDDYAIVAAINGERALKLASASPEPDIILLDVMMPGMSGYEVCAKLKEAPHTRDIPVIFVTALGEAEDEAHGLSLGAIDYITKPFNPALVKARVRNHIELRKAAMLREDVERMMHHDLKNPLTAVLSLPMLLAMSDNLEPDEKAMLKSIEESGQAMLAMINSSLDLFKIERGSYTLHPEDVDIASMVSRIFRTFEDFAATYRVQLIVTVDGVPAAPGQSFVVQGEEMLCYSMLSNLIKNAIQASPEGASVTVALKTGNPAHIEISNMGAVPESMRERFFEKYATCGKRGGTGIGTYSARLNAEVQGGTVALSSEAPGQTMVTIMLPA